MSCRPFAALGLRRDGRAHIGPSPEAIRSGVLTIYPTNLPSAQLEAKAEADLHLASTTSYSVCPSSLDQIPVEPLAMKILVGQTLEMLEVPNAFLPPTKARPEEMSISPDHLAALGLLGGFYDEGCMYEGLGVRACLPLELYEIVRVRPHLLPGIRFWEGIRHCRMLGCPPQPIAPWSDPMVLAEIELGEWVMLKECVTCAG